MEWTSRFTLTQDEKQYDFNPFTNSLVYSDFGALVKRKHFQAFLYVACWIGFRFNNGMGRVNRSARWCPVLLLASEHFHDAVGTSTVPDVPYVTGG